MSVRAVRRKAVAAAAAAVLLIACELATAGQAAAAAPGHTPAAAAKLSAEDVYASANVTSSTHKKLHLSVSANKSAKSKAANISVSVSRGSETHSWDFSVAGSAFVPKKKNGRVQVSSKSTHGYARISLSFSKSGKAKKTSCSSANYATSFSVIAKGSLHFATKSTGHDAWGTISLTKKSLHGGSYDTYGAGVTCYKFPCSAATGWDLYSNKSGDSSFIGGGTEGSKGYISASKSVNLGSYGSRTDSVSLSSPKPTLSGGGTSATYTVKTGAGQAHGSITLTASAAPSSYSQSCYVKKKKSTETESSWTATVMSHGFRVTEQVFGPFDVPTDGSFSSTKLG